MVRIKSSIQQGIAYLMMVFIIAYSIINPLSAQENAHLKINDRPNGNVRSIEKIGEYKFIIGNIDRNYDYYYGGALIEPQSDSLHHKIIIMKLDGENNYVEHKVLRELDGVVGITYGSGDLIYFVQRRWEKQGEIYVPQKIIYSLNEDFEIEELFRTVVGQDYAFWEKLVVKDNLLYISGTYNDEYIIENDTLSCIYCGFTSSIIFNLIYDLEHDVIIHFNKPGEHGGADLVGGMVVDKEGNVVTYGGYSPSELFILGTDTIQFLTGVSFGNNAYMYKLDKTGEPIFLVGSSSDGNDGVWGAKVDEDDNIYIVYYTRSSTAYFAEELLFDVDYQLNRAYIIKLNPDGELIWRNYIELEYVSGLWIDIIGGQVIINGRYQTGVNGIRVEEIQLPIKGDLVSYIIKLDKETGAYNASYGFKDVSLYNYLVYDTDVYTVTGQGVLSDIIPGLPEENHFFIMDILGDLTNIKEQEDTRKEVSVWPNPVAVGQHIKIKNLDQSIRSVALYTIHGRLIRSYPIKEEANLSYSLEGINLGVYLLHIQTEHYNWTKKIIIE